MRAVTTIGLEIAKSVFQVHGVDAAIRCSSRRQLRRRAVLALFQDFHGREGAMTCTIPPGVSRLVVAQ